MDEYDLALIDSLILKPRASWAELAETLGTSPATVTRRWARMRERGEAWVTAWPGERLWDELHLVLLRVRAAPRRVSSVAEEMAMMPHVLTLHETTGSTNLFALAVFSDWQMAVRSFARFRDIKGVRDVLNEVCETPYGSIGWRLGALAPPQRSQLAASTKRPSVASSPIDGAGRRLFCALSLDGRASWADLGRSCGTSADTEKRRAERLAAAGQLVLRCDMARADAGWPIIVLVWARLPFDALARCGSSVNTWPECRLVVGLSGTSNLLIALAVQRRTFLPALFQRLHDLHPELVVHEFQYVVRPVKLSNRLLDDHGRASAAVALDPWSSS